MSPEERTLWRRLRTGAERERREAREALAHRYARLVGYARSAVPWRGSADDEDDVRAAGRAQLAKSIGAFDPDRGLEFVTYAVKSIAGAMMNHVRDATKQRCAERPEFVALTGDLADTLEDTAPTPEDLCLSRIEAEDAVKELARVSSSWPERHREALLRVAVFGESESEAGEAVGYSQMHVSRVVRRAEAALGVRLPHRHHEPAASAKKRDPRGERRRRSPA